MPQALTVVVKPVTPSTTAAAIIAQLVQEPAIMPLLGHGRAAATLFFSTAYLTADVLLRRKRETAVPPTATLEALQVIDDDVLFLSL